MSKCISLTENRDFKRLYHRGKNQVHSLLVTYVMKNRLGVNRVGITTSSKIGNAVKRNRARRIIRAAYREMDVACGYDIVFAARGRTTAVKSRDVAKVMRRQLSALGLDP